MTDRDAVVFIVSGMAATAVTFGLAVYKVLTTSVLL